MEKNKSVIQELLKYKYELGHNAKEATRNINRAKKVDYARAKRWYFKFRSGKLDADKKRSGRPREVDRVAVVNAVEAHPSMTLRMLADDFDCHHSVPCCNETENFLFSIFYFPFSTLVSLK